VKLVCQLSQSPCRSLLAGSTLELVQVQIHMQTTQHTQNLLFLLQLLCAAIFCMCCVYECIRLNKKCHHVQNPMLQHTHTLAHSMRKEGNDREWIRLTRFIDQTAVFFLALPLRRVSCLHVVCAADRTMSEKSPVVIRTRKFIRNALLARRQMVSFDFQATALLVLLSSSTSCSLILSKRSA
jgi:hypothetical protein